MKHNHDARELATGEREIIEDEARIVRRIYLDTLRWVFIAVALIGTSFAMHAHVDD